LIDVASLPVISNQLAHSLLFLAHPLSSLITGEVLELHGGLQFD